VSIALAVKVQELERRLEALEQAAPSPRRLAVLYAQAIAMRAQGDALRADVRAILEAHPGPRRLKAYTVRSFLKREPLPSVRRVQEVMREIRREAAGTAREVAAHAQTRAV
jgi:hypothetical protein